MAEETKDGIVDEELEEEFSEDTQKGRFMTFQIGKEYYGISISYVNEIIVMQPITTIPEVKDYIKGLINLRGKIVPVIDVRMRFDMEPTEYNDRTCIIVLSVDSMTIGLIVEQIAEVNTIMEEDISLPPSLGKKDRERNKFVYGLARTEGTVKLLIDPQKLIQDEELETFERRYEKEEQ
ncbi:MAG: chemotaxis protein CheW [Lachnospiraceae bacterium]|nr:chemotaxis protein CheW [Lachnospiraceae bacterium]